MAETVKAQDLQIGDRQPWSEGEHRIVANTHWTLRGAVVIFWGSRDRVWSEIVDPETEYHGVELQTRTR